MNKNNRYTTAISAISCGMLLAFTGPVDFTSPELYIGLTAGFLIKSLFSGELDRRSLDQVKASEFFKGVTMDKLIKGIVSFILLVFFIALNLIDANNPEYSIPEVLNFLLVAVIGFLLGDEFTDRVSSFFDQKNKDD